MFRRTAIAGRTAAGPEGSLTAPLSGAACVWFKVRVESWQANADPHHRRTVCLLRRGIIFSVLSPAGPRLVSADVIRAEGPPVTAIVETVRVKRPPTRDEAPLLHALVESGLVESSELGRRAHLFDELVWETTEAFLPPGANVSVQGRLDRRSVLRHGLLTRSRFAPLPPS
ncbi:hypothetical protein Rhe02_72940 [Rhizocola hellebori]|uniref:Uncharacterized protein n=1 Tax=Rhizocola hellebori TaxID=1392758 RepID=A0A8J3QFS3_9ACTN|nr:hypothetical protein [Rhizocola hellebori]GIH09227.1 hypothetical protein Rhe02_72940 [Rhizocola hellebori]